MDGLGVVCQVVAGCKEEGIANVITDEIADGTLPSWALACSSLSPEACLRRAVQGPSHHSQHI